MRTRTYKILVVDADAESRAACVSAILPLGCVILEAPDAQQGYEKFVKEGADLVISADRLPLSSGVEMVRRIRQSDTSVPVLLLRRNGADDLEDEVVSLGNCKVVVRPLYPRQFRSLVEAALVP